MSFEAVITILYQMTYYKPLIFQQRLEQMQYRPGTEEKAQADEGKRKALK